MRSTYFFAVLFLTALCCFSCSSGIERSENEKLKRKNSKGEYIYRNHNEYLFAIAPPLHTPRQAYPWEGNLPRITKEFFRCRGSLSHPINLVDPEHPLPDCESRHGLPVLHGRETVYPILLDLLNYVQKTTGRRVIITCGHRCPIHNTWADPTKENAVSKHQIGAEVDFYVQGMEQQPLEVVQFLMSYYQGQKEFESFQRYESSDNHTETKPWLNKEIFIRVQSASEGRDADNRHPYPYITVQVRYDRSRKERVIYEWKQANLGYPRNY